MDGSAAGLAGAFVIASWSVALIRDTGAVLLDMNPDRDMADNLRRTIEAAAIGSPTCISGASVRATRRGRVGGHAH